MQQYTQCHRLKKADEFSSVFIFRKVKFGKFFKVYYKPTNLPQSRVGIIVSKKVHKRANKRNYMKRIIRELFRCHQCDWNSHDIIVRVHKLYVQEDFHIIKQDFLFLTKHMHKV